MMLSLSLQLLSIVLMSGGIYIEIKMKAHVGLILITIGSLVAFLSEKFRG